MLVANLVAVARAAAAVAAVCVILLISKLSGQFVIFNIYDCECLVLVLLVMSKCL